MRASQIELLLESKELSFEQVARMSSKSRVAIGLPPIIPQTDYNGLQRLVDSVVPGFLGLRRMFGLDQEINTDPAFTFSDDSLKNSQSYQRNLQFANQRASVYNLVEEMDSYDLVNSILDLYAEEATQSDPDTHRVVWIESNDNGLQADLMDLLNRLGMDDRAFSIIRTMCKYGDDIEQVFMEEGSGVRNLKFIHPARLSRIEDKKGRLQGFAAGILSAEESVWEKIAEIQKVSQPWDFVHFRLASNNRESLHGDSILLGARRAYQQLKMIEDMLILYRMSRGMDRDVYYVNVAGATASQGWRTTHEFRQNVRKKLGISPQAGMRQEYDMRTPDEDVFMPVNGKEDPTRVERQSGGAPQGDIQDVDHFRRKLTGSLRVPAAFIGFEVDTPSKATLASQYPRFARAIKRIQRSFKQGIRWLCEIHLIKKGVQTRDEMGRMLVKFDVRMAAVDQLEELAKAEIYNARIDLVTKMLSLVGLQQQPDPEDGMIIPGSGVIKNIDAWVGWVLRTFLRSTDAEIGLFLGDPQLGLTADMIDLRNMTEVANKNNLIKNFVEKTSDSIALIRSLNDDYIDADFTIDSSERAGNIYEDGRNFDIDDQENIIRERLGHTGKGPVIPCPSCRKKSMVSKYDHIAEESYLLCSCGYVSQLSENI